MYIMYVCISIKNFKTINADCKETIVWSFKSNSAKFLFIS